MEAKESGSQGKGSGGTRAPPVSLTRLVLSFPLFLFLFFSFGGAGTLMPIVLATFVLFSFSLEETNGHNPHFTAAEYEAQKNKITYLR